MKTIETDKGELVLKEFTQEFPFTYNVEGTLNGTDFEYFCGVHLQHFEQETLSINGFQDFHNFEDYKHDNGEEIFEEENEFNFNITFGINVNDFIDECKDFIENEFDNENNFLIFSLFGEIENIEIIEKGEKHDRIYFLIKDKIKDDFYELVIPEWYNANFGGACFQLLTDNIDDAIEEFGIGNIVGKEEINLYM